MGKVTGFLEITRKKWPTRPVAERVLAGRNPLSEEDVLQLGALGVTHVLDLREEREWADPSRLGREAVEALSRDGIERRSVPIRDGTAPSAADLTAATAWIDEVLARPGTRLFIHCRAGLERTATILAAWTARHEGLDFETALRRIRERGYPGHPLEHQAAAAVDWLERREGENA